MRHLIIISLLLSGCGGCQPPPEPCDSDEATPGARLACALDGWENRAYDAYLPDDYDPARPAPLLFAIHGGGGNRNGAIVTTCPGGDADSGSCMHDLAGERGYIVVSPDAIGSRLLKNVRTWNAGGGEDGWQCVSGRGCKDGIDDIAYFGDLLDELDRWLSVDHDRVYATGLSNGGAMSHRLACDMADRFAAIVGVGGANQVETVQGCDPSEPVAVMQIHGTDDPCWPYEGGTEACAQKDGGEKNSVADTMKHWAERNGCAEEPTTEPMPDEADDGTSTERVTYQNCEASVVLLRVEGGGHTWPDGDPYLRERRIGKVNRDFGSEVILDFFDENPDQNTNEQ